MVDAGSPDGVVAFFFEQEAAGRQVDTEPALDKKHDSCPLLAGVPRIAALALGVDAPLDLDRVGGADVRRIVQEVSDEPSAPVLAVGDRVAHVPVVFDLAAVARPPLVVVDHDQAWKLVVPRYRVDPEAGAFDAVGVRPAPFS